MSQKNKAPSLRVVNEVHLYKAFAISFAPSLVIELKPSFLLNNYSDPVHSNYH